MNASLALGRLTAVALGLATVTYAADAGAATVGYYRACRASGDISNVVAAGGRTVVPVSTLDAASLSNLDALVITVCPGGYVRDPDVDAAVSNGMGLVFERLYSGGRQDTTQLPGSPIFGSAGVGAYPEADDVEVAAGAPILSGVGGTLTSTSLDRLPGGQVPYYNIVNWYPKASLPAGAIPLLTTSNPDHVGAFAYTYGAGRVVYTDSQWTLQLPGGDAANANSFAAGGAVFLANVIDWAAASTFTSCSAEGLRGGKLLLCRQICEMKQSPSMLDRLIWSYRTGFREDPPCAR